MEKSFQSVTLLIKYLIYITSSEGHTTLINTKIQAAFIICSPLPLRTPDAPAPAAGGQVSKDSDEEDDDSTASSFSDDD